LTSLDVLRWRATRVHARRNSVVAQFVDTLAVKVNEASVVPASIAFGE
jgi:hypothetical protein